MVTYNCPKCNKEFNKSTNLTNHLKRKKPCILLNNCKIHEISQNNKKILQNNEIEIKNDFDNLLLNHIDELKKCIKNKTENTCIYCEKTFTKKNNLQRHIKKYCKSKKYNDELEKIKIKFEEMMNDNKYLLKENEELKNKLNNCHTITTNNIINKNQINNGIINNNFIVQFGSENIEDIDIKEAFKIFLKSTGGNIVSNMLKFVNLNEKYPQNHNIFMSDLSREIVKIFNGKKFIVKKFKDAKNDILGKAIVTTYKIVDKIENEKNIKKIQMINQK